MSSYKKAPPGGKMYLFWNCTSNLVKVGDGPNCVMLYRPADFMSRNSPRTSEEQALLLVTGDYLLPGALKCFLAGDLCCREIRTDRVISLPFNVATVGNVEPTREDLQALYAELTGEGDSGADEEAAAKEAAALLAEAAAEAAAAEAAAAEAAAAEAAAKATAEAEAKATAEEEAEAEAGAADTDTDAGGQAPDSTVSIFDQEGFDAIDWDKLAAQNDVVEDFTTAQLAGFGKVFSPTTAKDGKKSVRVAELLLSHAAVTH